MRAMIGLALGVVWTMIAGVAHGATPVISACAPKQLIVSDREDGYVELNGSDLARPDTSGFTIDKDVQVFARLSRGNGAWQPVSMRSWTRSSLSVRLPNDPFLKAPDLVEFKVVVRGMGESLPAPLMVQGYPTQPPAITWITSSVRQVTGEKPYATVNLTGKNFAPDATFVDNLGRSRSIGRLNAAEGEAVIWVDAARQGTYSLQVVTRAGKSAPATFSVVEPPQITATEPAKLQLADPLPADLPLRLSFASTQRPEIYIRSNETAGWTSAKTTDFTADAAVLHLAPAQLSPGQNLQIKILTPGGEAVAWVPVEKTMRVRSDVHLPRIEGLAPLRTPASAPSIPSIPSAPIR